MYIIEVITKDAPYISMGYVGEPHLVTSLSKAVKFQDEDAVKTMCQCIRREYDGKDKMRLMTWVYGITPDGKRGKRFYNLEK